MPPDDDQCMLLSYFRVVDRGVIHGEVDIYSRVVGVVVVGVLEVVVSNLTQVHVLGVLGEMSIWGFQVYGLGNTELVVSCY